MNKKPIEKMSTETEADSSTQDDGLQSVRRHNTNTNVAGSAVDNNACQTTHNLDFEVAESPYNIFGDIFGSGHKLFRVGTCNGQWGSTPDSYYILSVINEEKGNGHLTDVFEWFEFSCKRDNKNLLVLECINEDFYLHLLSKRGFIPLDDKGNNVIKVFNKKKYKQLKKKGNEIINAKTLQCV